MPDKPSPYIPLSWLREQRRWSKEYVKLGGTLTDYDLWLWIVRLEANRLMILELEAELQKVNATIESYRDMAVKLIVEG